MPPARSMDVDFLNPVFTFSYDDGFDFNKLSGNVTVSDTLGNPVNFTINKIDDASFKIKVLDKLKAEKFYTIKLNQAVIQDAAGNKLDSVLVDKFHTMSGLDFTGLSGKVENVDFTKNPMLLLASVDSPDRIYRQTIKQDSTFEFTRVLSGKYNLTCFLDVNNNGKFDFGYPYPFKPSERIKNYKTAIILPPRWAVTDLTFDFAK